MFAKLEGLEKKYMELEQSLADPDIFNDQERYRKLTKAHADLRDVVELYRRHRALAQELEDNRQLLHDADPEMRELAQEEVRRLEEELPGVEHELKVMLLPTDPLDEKNTILEIRAGTGGEEAALFAADLFRMYTRYAELKGWKTELMSESPSESGGFKEVICLISGTKVYSRLKFEAGTHRVQRVPATEAQGRIHTSAATVAVMPEAEEVDVEIRPEDLRIDIFRTRHCTLNSENGYTASDIRCNNLCLFSRADAYLTTSVMISLWNRILLCFGSNRTCNCTSVRHRASQLHSIYVRRLRHQDLCL